MKPSIYLCLLGFCSCGLPHPESVPENQAERQQIPRVILREPTVKQEHNIIYISFPVEITRSFHIQANPASNPYLIPANFEITSSMGLELTKIDFPPGKPYVLAGSPESLLVYDGKVEIGLHFVASPWVTDSRQITGKFNYQACDSRTCFTPEGVSFTIDI